MIDHRSYTHNLAVVKLKPEKNSGLNGIRTHNLCDTAAVLYQLSYQANWEQVTLRVHNIPNRKFYCSYCSKCKSMANGEDEPEFKEDQ